MHWIRLAWYRVASRLVSYLRIRTPQANLTIVDGIRLVVRLAAIAVAVIVVFIVVFLRHDSIR